MLRPKIKDKKSFEKVKFETFEAEPIEKKVRRIVDEDEPIEDGAPIIYTELKDGVRPEFNIRTDKWQIAIDAMDKVSNYEASKYLNGTNPRPKEETENESTKTETKPGEKESA